MKYLLSFIGVCLFYFSGLCQDVLYSYSGEYQLGTATYTYYITEKSTVAYHGNFKYEVEFKDLQVEGRYEHNKLHGYWKFIIDGRILSGQIEDNHLVGKWTYTESDPKQLIASRDFTHQHVDRELPISSLSEVILIWVQK